MSRLLFLLFIVMLCFSCAGNVAAIKRSSRQSISMSPLETPDSSWKMYKDIMVPHSSIHGSIEGGISPFRGALRVSIDSGDAYNNLFFTRTIGPAWTGLKWQYSRVDSFSLSLWFFVEATITPEEPNGCEVEGIEFIFQLAEPPHTWTWGIQWSKDQSWSVWDDRRRGQSTGAWSNIANTAPPIRSGRWNQFVLKGFRKKDQLIYQSFSVNDKIVGLHQILPYTLVPEDWAENFIQIGFQINGNKAVRGDHPYGVDPVTVYLKDIQLNLSQSE